MNRKYRQTQIITIIALVVVMLGVSVGFAAFSNVLTIGTTAAVKPDSSTFSVLFSSSGTTQATSAVSGTGSGGATGGSASISGTTISGLKANFTAPGQSVTYTFYAHNVGSYLAYLRNVTFGSGKSCTAGSSTNDDMVNAACDDISISVTIGNSSYTESSFVLGNTLEKGAYETIVVTISYSSNGDVADGDFSITFGDISLEYSSAEPNIISFTLQTHSYSAPTTTTTYYADKGMLWSEWIDSSYNTAGIAEANNGYIRIGSYGILLNNTYTKLTDTIVSGGEYIQSTEV